MHPHDDLKLPEDVIRDLAALARTAKLFREPALNALWAYQTTFAYVLRCFPSDLWNMPVFWRFVRPMSLADWERPLFYMNRVRKFDLTASDEVPAAPVFETLSLCLPTEHFFPNIDKLIWYSAKRSSFAYIRLLLGPRMTSIEIEFLVYPSHSYLSLIPTLPIRCPRLTKATICCDPDLVIHAIAHERLRESTSQFVRGLKHIESLRLFDLDQSAIEHLSSLPTLTCLTIEDLRQFQAFTPSPQQSDPFIFSNLTSIELVTPSVQVAIALTQTLSHSPLTDVDITIDTPASLDAFLILYSTVAKTTTRYSSVLGQFLRFHNLHTLWLNTPFDLDDTIMLDMARAWPHIERLTFVPAYISTIQPRATLHGLRALAQHWTKLKSLTILLDASEIPPQTLSTVPVIQCALTELFVGYSPIIAPVEVARFISGIFPKLVIISSVVSRAPLFGERWKDVQQFLTAARGDSETH
ncbi:hypothetical protein B0H13DRAFT_1726432 [Mycena leptocephala]|nr:hypothetical protein B0H13DRAFT_1726432 [Mycena leptocephala]